MRGEAAAPDRVQGSGLRAAAAMPPIGLMPTRMLDGGRIELALLHQRGEMLRRRLRVGGLRLKSMAMPASR